MADTALMAQQVYARMRDHGEVLVEAVAALRLTPDNVPPVRRHLAALGLIDAAAEVSVDAMSALGRLLTESRDQVGELTALAERVTRRQRAATELARRYLSLAGGGSEGVEALSREDRPRLERYLDEFAELAHESVLELQPPSDWAGGGYLDTDVRRRDALAMGNGARIRTLHAQITLNHTGMRHHLIARADAGVEVRYAPLVPTRVLVFDRHTAVVQGDPNRPEVWAVVIRDANIAAPLAALHDYCWLTASEAADVPSTVHNASLTEQQRTVLRLLGTGAKDDAIARGLGVSTRTVTRIVAELSAVLGAGSRFQAGVRAARLGWLD